MSPEEIVGWRLEPEALKKDIVQYGDERAKEAREALITPLVIIPSVVAAVALAEFQFEERARMAVGIKAMEWGDVSEVCRRNWLDRATEGLKAMVRTVEVERTEESIAYTPELHAWELKRFAELLAERDAEIDDLRKTIANMMKCNKAMAAERDEAIAMLCAPLRARAQLK